MNSVAEQGSGSLAGRVCLVTGAASGIGLATARAMAEAGACGIVISDIDETGGRAACDCLEAEGATATFVCADVATDSGAEATVAAVVGSYGRLDCAFNNAGIEGATARVHEYDENSWRRVIDVDLTGVFLGMRHQIAQMLDQGTGGAIVNASSVLGTMGYANLSGYVAAKHGVVGLTRAAALEYAHSDIRVNCVCPGFTETPMVMERGEFRASKPEVYQRLVAQAPAGRLGRPSEIADAVIWLSSESSSYVTGHALAVDGGMMGGLEGVYGTPLTS